jgi:hypothetical protein
MWTAAPSVGPSSARLPRIVRSCQAGSFIGRSQQIAGTPLR